MIALASLTTGTAIAPRASAATRIRFRIDMSSSHGRLSLRQTPAFGVPTAH
jgi:hypothetical protein